MKKVLDYTDATKEIILTEQKASGFSETREAIIDEQKALGFRLVEDQIHFDGNHFIFENDEPKPEPIPPRDLAAEINEIKAKIADYDDLKTKLREKGIL